MKMIKRSSFFIGVFTTLFSIATNAAEDNINFLSCPIVRDTQTVPCWLAEHDGKLYYLGIQQDIGASWYPPQLKHQVLVEGKVTDKTQCGGIVLEPIKTSVMPELDLSCNTILPADQRFTAAHAERGAGPKDKDTGNNRRRETPENFNAPFAEKTFSVYYDFDNDHLLSREFSTLRQAIAYAKDSNAKEINVTVHRGSVSLSNGNRLEESLGVINSREKAIAEWLRLAELPTTTELKINSLTTSEPSDGDEDWKNRRVRIQIKP